ncbi:hypothetical protein Nepgr_012590 [Nepenthes gracilis]|uniref:Uncharacterized protein n=1 Tax=Nepenthes gracilis TaxID=150966 RepID=A0AAD3SHH4_NEPGR|nr:hypothetical protein Nepgr_012590 [Nepenthes gracilis]
MFLTSSPLRPIIQPTMSTGTASRNTFQPGHSGDLIVVVIVVGSAAFSDFAPPLLQRVDFLSPLGFLPISPFFWV